MLLGKMSFERTLDCKLGSKQQPRKHWDGDNRFSKLWQSDSFKACRHHSLASSFGNRDGTMKCTPLTPEESIAVIFN